MKKKIQELEIGDHVRQTSCTSIKKRKVGEIISILSDNKKDPTIECIQIDDKSLEPIEKSVGKYKKFKCKRSKLKHYIPRKKLFKKKSFSVGEYIIYKTNGRAKYGRILGYLNKEEGLYPHSYDLGDHNGKDLLECVQVETKVGLPRILDQNNKPKTFIAEPNKCKLIDIIDVDDKGNPTAAIRLNI